MEDMESFYQWNEKWIAIGELHASYVENSWHKGNLEFLKTNSTHSLYMLWKHLCHLIKEAEESSTHENQYSVLLPDQFCNLSWKEFMTWTLQHSNQDTGSISNTGYQGQPKQDSNPKSNQNAYHPFSMPNRMVQQHM